MPDVWPRIAKIAGMLGSDQEGERLAAVRKIDQLLKAEKLGWSDFAKRLASGNGHDPDESIWRPPTWPEPPPKRRPGKPRKKPMPDMGRPGFPYWRTDVDRLTVWAYCSARTERGVLLQMSHRIEPAWLPRRYVWRSYPPDQPAPLDGQWQEWSLERWIVEREHLAERTI